MGKWDRERTSDACDTTSETCQGRQKIPCREVGHCLREDERVHLGASEKQIAGTRTEPRKSKGKHTDLRARGSVPILEKSIPRFSSSLATQVIFPESRRGVARRGWLYGSLWRRLAKSATRFAGLPSRRCRRHSAPQCARLACATGPSDLPLILRSPRHRGGRGRRPQAGHSSRSFRFAGRVRVLQGKKQHRCTRAASWLYARRREAWTLTLIRTCSGAGRRWAHSVSGLGVIVIPPRLAVSPCPRTARCTPTTATTAPPRPKPAYIAR